MDEYKSLAQVSLFLIDQTSKLSKQYSQKIFDDLGIDIHIDQWVLLKIIEENIPMSQKELADKSHRDPASITRTIDILEKKQFVSRERMAKDRRQYLICLSKKGKAFIDQNMPIVQQMRAQSLDGFKEKEIQTLNDLLLKMQSNLT
jgi:DNA-binding MarR family transcriptional regulator